MRSENDSIAKRHVVVCAARRWVWLWVLVRTSHEKDTILEFAKTGFVGFGLDWIGLREQRWMEIVECVGRRRGDDGCREGLDLRG